MQQLITQNEVAVLKSSEALTWLRQKAIDKQSKAIGCTNAQMLYRRLRDSLVTEGVAARSQSERVRKLNELIFEKIDEAFIQVGLDGFADVFMQELRAQRQAKCESIKQDAVKAGMVLWQATPLAKEQLEGGVLKGRIERPDLVWEEVFTGVCAFPDNKGAYVLKHADEKGGFACQADVNVRLTDDRLEGKKLDDVLGWLHGHKVTETDGFLPTVSLTGEVAGEWTSRQDVSIDESKPVTLRSLVNSGVHIFRVQEEDLAFIRDIKMQRIGHWTTRDQVIQKDIQIMEELAAHPEQVLTDSHGRQRQIQVKSYFADVQQQMAREGETNAKISKMLHEHAGSNRKRARVSPLRTDTSSR